MNVRGSNTKYKYASKEVLRSPQRELTLRPQGAPAYQQRETIYQEKSTRGESNRSLHNKDKEVQSRSPIDSHSYRRYETEDKSPRAVSSNIKNQTNQLKDGSRRRSLSFGHRQGGSSMVWKEKAPPSENDQMNTPFTSPIPTQANTIHTDPAAIQQMREDILSERDDKESSKVTMQYVNVPDPVEREAGSKTTMQYVNVPDPVEREARRQRVLEGETQNQMAERAASMLAHAVQNKPISTTANTNASNHAFYEAMDAEEDNPPTELEQAYPTPKKRRGRPPGKTTTTTTTARNVTLRGGSSRKRKVHAIQNSPRVRKSYANQKTTGRQNVSRQAHTSHSSAIPRPPRRTTTTTTTRGDEEEVSSPDIDKLFHVRTYGVPHDIVYTTLLNSIS
ncbi:hypothetical protein YC2023_016263 [Brassica napus]